MIVITGGAGFIGSGLIKKYNDLGRTDIIVVDRLESDEKWLNLRGLQYREYIHADNFYDYEILTMLLEEGVSAVYHMGACSDTTEEDMDYLMRNNVEYSQTLFAACTDFNIPICYASSAATYGDGSLGHDDLHDGIKKLLPLNKYGYSKQLFDEWVLRLTETPERWYGAKFFNVYGPNEYHKGKMSSVIYQGFNQIKSQGQVKLFKSHNPNYSDGGQLRDFVYVKDVVEAMYSLIEEDHNGSSGIYNFGTGKARSFADLAKATFSAMDLQANIEYIDMPENLRDQYQYYTQAKMTKLLSALPKFKFTELEDGVKDYVQNYLLNKDQRLNSRS